ncbi:MAG: endolytic transglycosylase MltG [Actinomycetota bacterium]
MSVTDPPLAEAPPEPSPHRSRRKRGLIILAVMFGVLFALVAGTILYVKAEIGGSPGPSTPVTIVVQKGDTAKSLSNELARKHVIKNAWLFRIYAGMDSRAKLLIPGQYQLATGMSFGAVLDVFARGPEIKEEQFTIPEGFTVDQVIRVIGRKTSLSASKLRAEIDSGNYRLPIMPKDTKSLEGLLFPKTYVVVDGQTTESSILKRMLEQFTIETSSLPFSRVHGLTAYQVVIVASLIEREAKVPGDRGKIAAVIYNRIKMHMRLQIDATVQYAIYQKTGQYKPVLTYADYGISSPWNTYQIAGFPPTPIANPGLASLEAAIFPANIDSLFYVLCSKDGAHAFARTQTEFDNLKRKCASQQ